MRLLSTAAAQRKHEDAGLLLTLVRAAAWANAGQFDKLLRALSPLEPSDSKLLETAHAASPPEFPTAQAEKKGGVVFPSNHPALSGEVHT